MVKVYIRDNLSELVDHPPISDFALRSTIEVVFHLADCANGSSADEAFKDVVNHFGTIAHLSPETAHLKSVRITFNLRRDPDERHVWRLAPTNDHVTAEIHALVASAKLDELRIPVIEFELYLDDTPSVDDLARPRPIWTKQGGWQYTKAPTFDEPL